MQQEWSKDFRRLGRTSRIGLIIPQLDILTEPLFSALLPAGVSLHTARMIRRGPVSSTTLGEMNSNLQKAIELLPTPYLDTIIYHCTMGSLLYKPEKLVNDIAAACGAPAICTTASVISAFRALRVTNLCLVSPYQDELNQAEVSYLAKAGLAVRRIGGERLSEAIDMARVAPEEICAWAGKAFNSDCEAVFITCTGLRSSEYIRELEEQLGVPVVTSSSAVIWDVFRSLKVPTRGHPGGQLFDI